MSFCQHISAQNPLDWCGTENNFEKEMELACGDNFSFEIDQNYLETFEPAVFNVFFWGINRGNGTSDDPLTETKALEAVANLNSAFNKGNIFFKYKGLNNTDFNSDLYYDMYGVQMDTVRLTTYAFQEGLKEPNTINIYVPFDLIGAPGYSGPHAEWLVVDNTVLDRWHLNHEMGHLMFLWHTFQRFEIDDVLEDCEHVTRDPSDPVQTYNATIAGDRVVDTPAQLGFNQDPLEGPVTVNTNCDYIGSQQDCEGFEFQINPTDVRNFMNQGTNCPSEFTTGQFIRMHENIVNDCFNIYRGPNNFMQTDVASLYEPYKGEYYVNSSLPPPATAATFQPGFQYEFVYCDVIYSGETPTAYNDVSFNFNLATKLAEYGSDYQFYDNIIHPNRSAIRIKELEYYTNDPVQPRKCYDVFNRANGGKVTKFNDNTFNNNVTITPKDSTEINEENLIEQLPNGLYVIDKNYEDGTTEQQVIQKGNN